MINAKEANAMTKANVYKDEQELSEKLQKFLNENCEEAILEAVENRRYSTFIEIPGGLENYTARICALLTVNGYKAQTRHGVTPSILVSW